MYVYLITNEVSGSVYVGITRTSIKRRFSAHKCAAKRGVKQSILYDAMRSYGVDNFSIRVLEECPTEEDMLKLEYEYIEYYRELLGSTYNVLDGGITYFPIKDKDAWKSKLRKARVGRKPAKGMKHSSENKVLFSKVSREYWDTQETYDAVEVVKYSFKEAAHRFGISKTHYYRLKKRLGIPSRPLRKRTTIPINIQ